MRDGWFDQRGLNLIRVVIGSYFVAVALGMADGFDLAVLFGVLVPTDQAQMLSSLLILVLAGLFMAGVFLRASALLLATCVLVSGGFSQLHTFDMSSVWEDAVIVCAILLCYGPLRRHELHKAALFSTTAWRGEAARLVHGNVAPRRVRAKKRNAERGSGELTVRSLRPLIAPTSQMMGLADDDRTGPRKKKPLKHSAMARIVDASDEDEEILNIFVNT